MRTIGYERVPLDDIVVPPTFLGVMQSDEAKARAESIKRVDVMQPIRVRKADMALVYGQHRLAGSMLAGRLTIPTEYVDCTDDEIEDARIDENLERRVLPAEEVARLTAEKVARTKRRIEASQAADEEPAGLTVDKTESQLIDTVSIKSPPRLSRHGVDKVRNGRPTSTERAARQDVAKKLGITERTVERRQKRAVGVKAEAAQPKAKAASFDDLGLPLSDEQRARFDHVARASREIAKQLKQVRVAVRECDGYDQGFTTALDALVDSAERNTLSCVCPACKLHARLGKNCTFCSRVGLISADARAVIEQQHPILLDRKEHRVLVGNKIRRLAEI